MRYRVIEMNKVRNHSYDNNPDIPMSIARALNDRRFRDGEMWARPITWRRSGYALKIEGEGLIVTPADGNKDLWVPRRWELADRWELVRPSDLEKELPPKQ